MEMPKTIAGWCMILFFLWFGLKEFVAPLADPIFMMLGGVLALGVAVFTFLNK